MGSPVERIVEALLGESTMAFWLDPNGRFHRVPNVGAHEHWVWQHFGRKGEMRDAYARAFKEGWVRGYVDREGPRYSVSLHTRKKPSRQELLDLTFDVASYHNFSMQSLGKVYLDWNQPSRGHEVIAHLMEDEPTDEFARQVRKRFFPRGFAPHESLDEKENRDYKREYRLFRSTTKSKKKRASRNKARRQAEREGRVRKGDGKDIDHRDGNALNNSPKNLRVVSRSTNRAKH